MQAEGEIFPNEILLLYCFAPTNSEISEQCIVSYIVTVPGLHSWTSSWSPAQQPDLRWLEKHLTARWSAPCILFGICLICSYDELKIKQSYSHHITIVVIFYIYIYISYWIHFKNITSKLLGRFVNHFSHPCFREFWQVKWPCRGCLPELKPKCGVCFCCWLSWCYLQQMLLALTSQMLTGQDFTSFWQGFSSFSKFSLLRPFCLQKQSHHGNQFLCIWQLIHLWPEIMTAGGYHFELLVAWDLLIYLAGLAFPQPAWNPLWNMQPSIFFSVILLHCRINRY